MKVSPLIKRAVSLFASQHLLHKEHKCLWNILEIYYYIYQKAQFLDTFWVSTSTIVFIIK